MNLKKQLNNYHHFAADTNVFIYYFNRLSPFHHEAETCFIHIAESKKQILTSMLTLTELLSFKTDAAMIGELESKFLQIPQLSVIVIDREIASNAAKIRRDYGFRLVDSIQLATAVHEKAQAFITNDQKLKKYKELPIVLLSEM